MLLFINVRCLKFNVVCSFASFCLNYVFRQLHYCKLHAIITITLNNASVQCSNNWSDLGKRKRMQQIWISQQHLVRCPRSGMNYIKLRILKNIFVDTKSILTRSIFNNLPNTIFMHILSKFYLTRYQYIVEFEFPSFNREYSYTQRRTLSGWWIENKKGRL